MIGTNVEGFEVNLNRLRMNDPTFEEWNVRGLTQEQVIMVFEALKTNNTLHTLIFEHNSTRDEGAKHLGEVLMVNTTLRVLNLKNNMIGTQGVIHLIKGLRENETLHTLNLERAIVQKQGIKLFIWWLKSNFLRRHKSQTSGSHGHHKPQVLGHHKLRGPVR